MENEPEILTISNICHSIAPVVLHYCPEQCVEDNIIKCCYASYVTKSTRYECDNLPGVVVESKYSDPNDCTCNPCR